MRSKEAKLYDCIDTCDFVVAYFTENQRAVVFKAMKEHAIEFAKEINRQGYREYDQSDRWIKIKESSTVYSTEQLYEKFEKEK